MNKTMFFMVPNILIRKTNAYITVKKVLTENIVPSLYLFIPLNIPITLLTEFTIAFMVKNSHKQI